MSIKTVIKKFSTETTMVNGQIIVHDLSEMCADVVPDGMSSNMPSFGHSVIGNDFYIYSELGSGGCLLSGVATETFVDSGIRIVDPDNGAGTDYTSLAAFEAAERADLVALGRNAIAECRSTSGTADSTSCTFAAANWTTNSTYKIIIRSTGANRHVGYLDTNKYRRTASVRIIGDTEVSGLQITAANGITNGSGTEANLVIHGCIMTATGSNCINLDSTTSADSVCRVYNNIFYSMFLGVRSSSSATNFTTYIENCTGAVCTGALVLRTSGTILIYNCLLNSAVNMTSGTISVKDYNASSHTTASGGANDRVSQTFTFVDAGANNYLLQSSDAGAKGYGTDAINLGFTTDILGNTRSVPWDIGAHEVSV